MADAAIQASERREADRPALSRRLVRWLVRGVVAVVLLIALLLVAGFAWEQVASRGFEEKYPAPGEKVTLSDGRALHFVVKGEGEPTIVLESGAGGPHTDWDPVIDDLAKTTRVIAYDRAGYGWSDPSPATNAVRITADLHEGLEALGVSGPMVLVGHSIGGMYVRRYRSTHPADVVGLVLVDSSHEEQMERMPPALTETMRRRLPIMNAVAFASRFGLLRALSFFGVNPLAHPDMRGARRAMASRSSMVRASVRELNAIEATLDQAKIAATPCGDLPILVLSATQAPAGLPPAIEEDIDAILGAWRALQAKLARLSTNTRHVRVPGASHYVQADRPDVVIEEIRAMIDAIRAGEPMTMR